MAKKRAEIPQRQPTRRQLSRWQEQRRRQRIILSLGISIIVAVLGIVGAGWYASQYRPLHQTVIRVNDAEFDMNYYIRMLKHYGKDKSINYLYGVADDVVKVIERNELVRQGAMELGISVSNSEVDDELKGRSPPLSKDYRDLVRTEILADKLRDEYFDKQVPVSAEQTHIMVMLLESESQATEVRARLEGGEDFTEVADELSVDSFSQAKKGDLDWHPESVLTILLGSSIPVDYAFNSEVGVLSQPIYDEERIKGVGYWLIEVLEREEGSDEAHVQAILLGSEEEAQQVRSRLGAGEDFATLAKELSQEEWSKESGGDLDWLTEGMMSSAFDEFAFDTGIELKTLSEPIRDDAVVTKGGYWLVKVVDKDDNKQISDDDRSLLKTKALNDWVSALWDDPENKVDDYLDSDKKLEAVERAAKQLGLS